METLSSTENQGPNPSDKWYRISPARGMSLLDYLYNAMDGAYPGSWSAKFKNEQTIQNWRDMWADRFTKEGLTLRQVLNGIEQCPTLYVGVAPTLGQFVIACRTVKPLCHRDFPQARLTDKGTPEGRAAGLKMMREKMDEIERRRQRHEA